MIKLYFQAKLIKNIPHANLKVKKVKNYGSLKTILYLKQQLPIL